MQPKKILKGYSNRALAKVNLLPAELEDLASRRLDICHTCSIFDSKTLKCQKELGGCGCNMKSKVYCRECKCPKGLW